MKKRDDHITWRKLDNTAQLFPVIANKEISHVYRISSTLKEEVRPDLLQQALEDVLPWFDVFRVRLRRGFFWFYFEENKNRPQVEDETGTSIPMAGGSFCSVFLITEGGSIWKYFTLSQTAWEPSHF